MRRTLHITTQALACWVIASALLAAPTSRIAGEVVDSAGEPVADALVVVVAREVELERRDTTNRKGKFNITILDTSRTYDIHIQKEGYLPLQEPLDLPVGGVLRRTWTLRTVGEAQEELARIEERNEAAKIYNRGVEAYSAGDLDTAIALFEQTAEQAPELAEPWAVLARIHLERQEHEEALAAARKLDELRPGEVLPLRLLYDSLWLLGQKEEAAEVLERLIALDAGQTTAARVFNVGVEALQAGRQDEAVQAFERSIEIYPELEAAHTALAQILLAEGRNEEALERAARVLEINPDSSRALMVQLAAHRNLGNVEEAEEAFAALQAGDPDQLAESYFQEGQHYFNQNRTPEATAAFERVLEARPDHAAAHYMLGLCRLQAGETAEARAMLEKFLELAPEHPEAGTARDMLQALP